MDMNLSKLGQIVKDRGAWHATVHGVAKSRTWGLKNGNNQVILMLYRRKHRLISCKMSEITLNSELNYERHKYYETF